MDSSELFAFLQKEYWKKLWYFECNRCVLMQKYVVMRCLQQY